MNVRILLFFLFMVSMNISLSAQKEERAREWHMEDQFLTAHRAVISFTLVNNLIVLPISINGAKASNFILDTGVGSTLLFGVSEKGISLENSESVFISGLGDGTPIQAFIAKSNRLELGRLRADSLDVLVLENDIFDISQHMGMHIHGLIGYDLLADFVTEINYQHRTVTFYEPDLFRKKSLTKLRLLRWKNIPLILVNKKPYLTARFQHGRSSQPIAINLLIDSGMSGALSLFTETNSHIVLPHGKIRANVGLGLSGDIEGYLGRISSFEIAGISYENPVAAYPDSAEIHNAYQIVERNGSVGAEILRRNKIILNYRGSEMYLRSNSERKAPFEYNVLGIDISTPTPNLPLYYVTYVRPDSPAFRKEIAVGDRITHINGVRTETYDFNSMLLKLHDLKSPTIELGLQRDIQMFTVQISLKDILSVDK